MCYYVALAKDCGLANRETWGHCYFDDNAEKEYPRYIFGLVMDVSW